MELVSIVLSYAACLFSVGLDDNPIVFEIPTAMYWVAQPIVYTHCIVSVHHKYRDVFYCHKCLNIAYSGLNQFAFFVT